MKILLDECVTRHLKPYLSAFEVFTVREMQWGGIKNGKLLSLCVEHQFDILLTIDKNLRFQQNMENHGLSVIIFNSRTSKLEELILFLPNFIKQIKFFQKHKVYIIEQ